MRTRHHQRGFWNFLIPAAASVIGGVLSSKGTRDTNQSNQNLSAEQNVWNAHQAALARQFEDQQAGRQIDFQKDMANTSYQRAVGDMQAAGLNPMLAYSQGGAPAPSGAAGSASPAQGISPIPRQNPTTAGLNAAFQAIGASNAIKQGENIDADTELKRSQAQRETASAGELVQRAQSLHQGIRKMEAEIQNIAEDTTNKNKQGKLIDAQTQLSRISADLEAKKITHTEALIQVERVRKDLLTLDVAINLPAAEFAKSDVGEDKPLIKLLMDLGRLIQSGRR